MATDKKAIPYVVLDSSVLTNGMRVLVGGVDISQFEKNPVMLYDHNDWQMPIGRWENVRKENEQLLADAVFDYDDDDEQVQRIIGKVERGFMRASTVGLADLEGSIDTDMIMERQDGPTITKCRLREISITAIGRNHNALRLYDKDGKVMEMDEKTDTKLLLSDFIVSPKIKIDMKINLKNLNLSDGATDDQVNEAIDLLLRDKKKAEDDLLSEKLKAEAAETAKNDLQAKLDGLELADKTARKAAFEKELNTAFLDGRLSEKPVDGKPTPVKDRYLSLFDKHPEVALEMVQDLVARTPKSLELSDTPSESAWDKRKAEIEKNAKK